MKFLFKPLAVLTVALAWPVAAQEHIPLDQATSNRLGLVFARLAVADGSSGTRVPASVIASPRAAAQVHALHEGVLESWSVTPGTEVAAGDELALLRSSAVLDLQQQWMAAYRAAEQAEISLARDERLFEAGVIAGQRVSDSRRSAASAVFQRDGLAAALGQAGFVARDLQALVDGRGDLGLYRVRAPLAGVVGSLAHRSGELIAAGEMLLSFNSTERWLSARVPVRLATRLEPGQKLAVAGSNETLELRQLDQAVDPQTQTAELLAVFTAPTQLLPGQIVTLVLPPVDAGVVVPAEAVVHNGDETILYVRVQDGVEARSIALQPAGGDYLATAGVSAGEEVVVRGAALLKGVTLGLGGE